MKRTKALVYGFAGAMIMAWIGNYFYDSTKDDVKSVPILKYVTTFLNWLYDTAISILNFPIRVWWLIVTTIVLYLIYKVSKSAYQGNTPDFINYKEDVFKIWIWRWDWKPTNEGWKISNLTGYCPKDDVQLVNNSDFLRVRFYCPKCNTEFGEYKEPLEYTADAEVLIRDKINKGNYYKTN